MCDVTKHHSEEEWEGDTCEDSRIDFLVHRDTICVDNLLKAPGEIVRLDVSGRRDAMAVELLEVSCWMSLKFFSKSCFFS
jgi:hypothetical protein